MDEKWDRRFLELAKHVAGWSKDPSTQVGAVLVDDNRKVVGLGYNGFAQGVMDLPERYNDRETKYKYVVHAEVNAILSAGAKTKGATLYVWPSFALPPICNECCKLAVQAGVKEIIGYEPEQNRIDSRFDDKAAERHKRWQESIGISKAMCDEAGVRYRGIQETKSNP